jgi:hypothetical protein
MCQSWLPLGHIRGIRYFCMEMNWYCSTVVVATATFSQRYVNATLRDAAAGHSVDLL